MALLRGGRFEMEPVAHAAIAERMKAQAVSDHSPRARLSSCTIAELHAQAVRSPTRVSPPNGTARAPVIEQRTTAAALSA